MFVEVSKHGFGGEDVFALMEFLLTSLRPFLTALRFADESNLLQVSLSCRVVFIIMGVRVGI